MTYTLASYYRSPAQPDLGQALLDFDQVAYGHCPVRTAKDRETSIAVESGRSCFSQLELDQRFLAATLPEVPSATDTGGRGRPP